LGQKLIDPYGNDYEDLSVITIVTTCIEITRICLNSHNQPVVDPQLETSLHHHHNQLSSSKGGETSRFESSSAAAAGAVGYRNSCTTEASV